MATGAQTIDQKTPGLLTSLAPHMRKTLRCPVCGATLADDHDALVCTQKSCAERFPILEGKPLLINPARSLFSLGDFQSVQTAAPRPERFARALRHLRSRVPLATRNLGAESNLKKFASILKQRSTPRVLVVGGGILGAGMHVLANDPAIELCETDVYLGPRTQLVADAHDLPFADATFDGVVIQAVICYLTDPVRAVAEIHRVLRPGGLVYAETPFIQRVSGGRFDLHRFTHLGHRRLFRHFEEIRSEAVCGPAMALAGSYEAFLTSFATTTLSRGVLWALARCTSFWLRHFDPFLLRRPGAYDASSSYCFLGEKSDRMLSDREIMTSYRGAVL